VLYDFTDLPLSLRSSVSEAVKAFAREVGGLAWAIAASDKWGWNHPSSAMNHAVAATATIPNAGQQMPFRIIDFSGFLFYSAKVNEANRRRRLGSPSYCVSTTQKATPLVADDFFIASSSFLMSSDSSSDVI
jgi:hypothetical protein